MGLPGTVIISAALSLFLIQGCSKSGDNITGSRNSASPSTDTKDASTATGSPGGIFQGSSGETFGGSNTSIFSGTDTDGGGIGERCLSDFGHLIQEWLNAAAAVGGTLTTNECKNIQYKIGDGKPILKIKLEGNCTIEVDIETEFMEEETDIPVC